MEKVWFKLRQKDYPPPPEDSMGTNEDPAPICLGHFISDLKRIDFVLNRGAIEEFPRNMMVYKTETIDFKWDDAQDSGIGASFGGGGPAALGVMVKGSIKLAFSQSVQNHEAYDRLDSYIVQPTKSYIADCLEGEQLSALVGKKMWTMFMITGIRIARKGTKKTVESSHQEIGSGSKVVVPAITTTKANVNIVSNKLQMAEGSEASDFVWAVRLAKVHKGLLMSDWSLDPYIKRATFGSGEVEEVDVVGTVAAEGLDKFKVFEDEELDEAIVMKEEADTGEGPRL